MTDAKGQKKAIVIDLKALRPSGQTGHNAFLDLEEQLEDLIDLELTKNE